MNLFKIAWRSVRQRSLSSSLTGLSMALGVALIVMVLVILNTVEDTFRKNSNSWDMIIGAKGSKLQLVLNSVFHLSTPVENIPYWKYKELREKYTSMNAQMMMGNVKVIPVCMGDSYEGHRVVATIPELFEIPYSQDLEYEFAGGRNFKNEAGLFEAVIGSVAANKTGIQVGQKINPTHGISNEGDSKEHDAFTVVGILSPTGTPNDRAIFINMEGFYLQENHALSDEQAQQRERERAALHGESNASDSAGEQPSGTDTQHEEGDHDHEYEPLPEEKREVTAVLIRFDPDKVIESNFASMKLRNEENEGPTAQAVLPVTEITNLFDTFIEPLRALLMFLTVLIIIVAGIGIMVGIYNTMNDRKRDIAVMRALGAGRMTVMTVILVESTILAIGGGLLGFVLGHAAIGVISGYMSGTTGVEIPFWQMTWHEAVLLPGLVLLAAWAGFWPALSAYRTDVSRSLTATP